MGQDTWPAVSEGVSCPRLAGWPRRGVFCPRLAGWPGRGVLNEPPGPWFDPAHRPYPRVPEGKLRKNSPQDRSPGWCIYRGLLTGPTRPWSNSTTAGGTLNPFYGISWYFLVQTWPQVSSMFQKLGPFTPALDIGRPSRPSLVASVGSSHRRILFDSV